MFFTFGKLINIVLRPISLPQPEPLLLYKKSTKNTTSFAFYINNIFGAFKIYQEKYIFLHDYFFLCMVWFKLKLAFSKLKIKITKIFALGEEQKIGEKVRLKLYKIGKILT